MPAIKDPWIRFQKFSGLQTKADRSKVDDGAATGGENTEVNDNERISNRKLGYEVFPTGSINLGADAITSLHTFRKRDGSNVMMRSHSTVLQYFNNDTETWCDLKTGYTSGQVFGYGDYNINTDLHSYVYFGNAVENFSRWDGGYGKVASRTSNTITKTGDTFSDAGFAGTRFTITGATTQFNIVNVSGSTYRYIWNGVGTFSPTPSLSAVPNGTKAFIYGDNFSIGNDIETNLTGVYSSSLDVVNPVLGDSTTQWNITNTAGNTWRYTWNTVGTNPGLTSTLVPVGTYICLAAQTDNAANKITTPITAINTNYFEVTNASGVAGSNIPTGTGHMTLGIRYFDITNAAGVAEQNKALGTGYLSFDYYNTPVHLTINGVDFSYTGGAYSNTITGVTPDPTTNGVVAGDAFNSPIDEFPGNPKGNIYLVYNNRLFISGIKVTPQAIYFSKYGDATNFVSASLVLDSTAVDPGIFNLGEGGGGVVGMSFDEQSMYYFKKAIIYKATLTDALYTLQPLKPFDGKSQIMGLASSRGVFTSGNASFVFTADGAIMALERVQYIDYPQSTDISDIIKDTINNADFSSATGISFNGKSYFTFKSSSSALYNDTVLVWDIENKYWDTPITGWNVTDFTVFDDGNGDALYFASANSTNIFKVIYSPVDGDYNVRSSWYSKLWDFTTPEKQKVLKNIFIEGNISAETSLSIKLNLDDDGYSGSYSTVFNGTETDFIYNKTNSNAIGEKSFGTEVFGSTSQQVGGKKRFRIYLNKNLRDIPFYNCQLIFSSDGKNQDWEIINIAFDIQIWSEPLYRKLFRLFS